MRIDIDSYREILDTLTRNKSRSFLTGFGVFWGVFMLVALIGGGQGLKHRIPSSFGHNRQPSLIRDSGKDDGGAWTTRIWRGCISVCQSWMSWHQYCLHHGDVRTLPIMVTKRQHLEFRERCLHWQRSSNQRCTTVVSSMRWTFVSIARYAS